MLQTNTTLIERLRTLSGLPQTTVVGTLTGDPEIKALSSGAVVVSVNIACNDRKYNKDTNSYEDGDTTFLRGTIWRQYAENVAESLRKGDKVIATGRLKMRSWEKDGQKRSTFELEIDEIGPTLRFVTAPTSRSAGKDGLVSAGKSSDAWGSTEEPGW